METRRSLRNSRHPRGAAVTPVSGGSDGRRLRKNLPIPTVAENERQALKILRVQAGTFRTGNSRRKIPNRFKIGPAPASSSSPRKTDRHCPAVPSAAPSTQNSSSAAVPNVRPSIHTGRCAMSSSRPAKHAGATAGQARPPAAAPAGPGSRRWCSRRALRPRSSHNRGSSSSSSLSRCWSARAEAGLKPHASPAQKRNRREDQGRCKMLRPARAALPSGRRPRVTGRQEWGLSFRDSTAAEVPARWGVQGIGRFKSCAFPALQPRGE